jgi:hypothetical protein
MPVAGNNIARQVKAIENCLNVMILHAFVAMDSRPHNARHKGERNKWHSD